MGSEGVIPVFVIISRLFSRLANVARLVASCGAKQQKKEKATDLQEGPSHCLLRLFFFSSQNS